MMIDQHLEIDGLELLDALEIGFDLSDYESDLESTDDSQSYGVNYP